MDQTDVRIDYEKISEMLFHEEKYILEFAEASIKTFIDFSDHYSRSLHERDLESFSRAGHKVRPVAKILGMERMLAEFDRSRRELERALELQESVAGERKQEPGKIPAPDFGESAERVRNWCRQVAREFEMIIDKVKQNQKKTP